MNTNLEVNNNSYVPAHLAIQAMRDNGYKNSAYALSELIDNSIQAGAKNVDLLIAEKEVIINSKRVKRIHEIAVLDDGSGMDIETLKIALQFGNGTRLDKNNRTGIGRFGMGLPSSSISQCKRVDVWSWKNGIENAYHTRLDVEEIKSGEVQGVPNPVKSELPDAWKNVIGDKKRRESGTLILWSNIDKLTWKTSIALIQNTESEIGRIYRYFLQNDNVVIRMKAFDVENPQLVSFDKNAKANDPMYLMANTTCPTPYDEQSLFENWFPDKKEEIYYVEFEGDSHPVTIRVSVLKNEFRKEAGVRNIGSTPQGKHAAKNIGISIVRAGRELELDKTMVNGYDPRERWWGAEIEFPPGLDELMGVSNNKQSARALVDMMKATADLIDKTKNEEMFKEEFSDGDEAVGKVCQIVWALNAEINRVRDHIKKQGEMFDRTLKNGNDANTQDGKKAFEEKCNNTINELEGKKEEQKTDVIAQPTEEEKKVVVEDLKDKIDPLGSEEEMEYYVKKVLQSDDRLIMEYKSNKDVPAFFSVDTLRDKLLITVNRDHLVYRNYICVLEEDVDNLSHEELKDKFHIALEGLRLLLVSWAYMEDRTTNEDIKENIRETRLEWGKFAKTFLKDMNK